MTATLAGAGSPHIFNCMKDGNFCNRSVCRPLTAAVAAAGRGEFVLDGVARMRERPIQDLVDGLCQLGVVAQCSLGTGCPPVTVQADGLPSGTVSTICLFIHLCIMSLCTPMGSAPAQ